jgi:hypothetical protein
MNFSKLTTLTLTLAVAGCGTSLGFLRDSTTAQRFNYSLDLKEVSMQRTVQASTEAKTIICIIPTDGDPPYATAMKRLYAEAKLGPNEVLVNIREDKRILTYLIYCKHRLTISADVYRLGRSKPKRAASPTMEAPMVKAEAKPKPEPPPDPCEEKYWSCMKYCGTRGCGSRCVKEKTKCDSGKEIKND